MKYFKLTFAYLKKNWPIAILSLALGTVLSVARLGGGFFAFLGEFFDVQGKSFFDVYGRISPIIGSWWATILAVIGSAVFFAYIVGVIDRHMKIGQFRLGAPMRKINENFAFTLMFLVVFVLFEEIVNVLLALTSAAFSSFVAPVAAYLITILAFLLFQGFALMLFVMGALWVPECIITGMGPKEALSTALEMGKGHFGKMFLGAIMGILPAFLVSMLGVFVGPVLRTVLNALSATLLVAFVPTFVFTAYYEISDLEREDLNPVKNVWNR